ILRNLISMLTKDLKLHIEPRTSDGTPAAEVQQPYRSRRLIGVLIAPQMGIIKPPETGQAPELAYTSRLHRPSARDAQRRQPAMSGARSRPRKTFDCFSQRPGGNGQAR